MTICDIIGKKKNGVELSKDEIYFFVYGVAENKFEESAIGSFLMATLSSGMSAQETYHLTMAMASSGQMCDLSGIDGIMVDKHSSGGVSDSTTLIVSAIVSCLGLKVAKMSGRGLGHTGGTIDKLESFSGYQVNQTIDSFKKLVNDVGVSIIAQTDELVPTDKKLYSIRDISGTVGSIPLIASSIMSKKLASGVDTIVLDVKYGSGAFMKTAADAVKLASLMTKIGNAAGRTVTSFVTSMQQPLGNNIGCNLEMREVLSVLKGEVTGDLYVLSREMSAKLLVMSGLFDDISQARMRVDEVIANKQAFSKLKEIIAAHEGTTDCFEDIDSLKLAQTRHEVIAKKNGAITAMLTEQIGKAVCEAGGGRVKKNDKIDHTVGVVLRKRLGESFEVGDVLAVVYAKTANDGLELARKIENALIFNGSSEYSPLIYAIIDKNGIKYDSDAEKIVRREEGIMSYTQKMELEAEDFKLRSVAAAIDHTLLGQTTTVDMIRRLCSEAKQYGFAAVCVQPIHVALAKECLIGTNVKVCTVVGFPYGETLPKVKVLETKQAIKMGADEIDMVISVSHVKQSDYKYVAKEIAGIVKAANKHIVKVIIEASQLTRDEILKTVDAAVLAKANFIKTSTGLFGKGATAENIEIIASELKKLSAANVQIKASGGIKNAGDVYELMNKGATRIGTSNSIAIINELKLAIEDKKAKYVESTKEQQIVPEEDSQLEGEEKES